MEKQSTGSTSDEGKKYEQMAYTSLQKKDFKEAEINFLTALKHIEDSVDETGQAYTLGNLGNIYFQRRRWDEAPSPARVRACCRGGSRPGSCAAIGVPA